MLKLQAQLKGLEGQSSIDVLKIDLKEICLDSKSRRLNYQENLGSEQHDKGKQKMQDYSQKRRKIAEANLKIQQFKLLIKEGPYYICVFCHRSFYRRSPAQKVKFSIKDFSSKCDQISSKLRIWSHLLEKSLMENFIFCAVISLNF